MRAEKRLQRLAASQPRAQGRAPVRLAPVLPIARIRQSTPTMHGSTGRHIAAAPREDIILEMPPNPVGEIFERLQVAAQAGDSQGR